MHAAYPADRRFVLTAHFNCRLVGSDRERPLWFNDCDTHPASSGGPLFTKMDGVFKLTAIMLGEGSTFQRCPSDFGMDGLDAECVCP